MSLKVIFVYFSLLAFLSSCIKDNELAKNDGESGAYHNIDIHISSSDMMDSRAANPAEMDVLVEDMALVVVDNNNREILDVSMMQKKSESLYSCLIPSSINLTTSNFYTVANVRTNFTNILDIKGKTLDYLLDTKLRPNNVDNNSVSVSPLHYVLMNNTAATYNQATNSISSITLSRLPSRIYLDCTKLGYPVEKITFKNIAKQTTLRTIIDKIGNVTDADVTDWQDTDPQIMPEGKSYYYLVYPSRKNAAVIITANGQERQVDLGEIKPGASYTLRINYPEDINFDGITADGVLNTITGDKIHEFKVSNTAHIRTVRFTSSDPNIFTVAAGTGADWYKFTIKGINPGKATLTAICDGVTITCKIIVTRALGALTVTVNEAVIGSYNTGDVVRVNAPFLEFKKFSSWTANPLITATNNPSFTFTMPQHNVEFTANYAVAPYKITVTKPGRIANDRSGTIDTALIQQTATNDVRYYELSEQVFITIPNEDKLFISWGSTSYQINANINVQNGGGGNDKPTSWFKMPNIGNNEVITPNLKRKLYWSSRATAKGHIIANFVDRINPAAINSTTYVTIPGNAKFGRAYTEVEKSAIMRALNNIENIFADAPRRPLKITFSITEGGSSISGGGTEPVMADRDLVHWSYELPKLKWLASDMGGRATGKDAASSKFEAVWRDKKNIYPDDGDNYDNNFVGFCDGYVTLYDGFVSHSSMYKGESIEGFKGITDFETVIMHEVAHIICYHAYSQNYIEGGEGLTALDVYIGERDNPTKSLVNGNYTMGGPIQIVPLLYSEAVHKRLNYYPMISPGDFHHLNFDGLGAHYYMHMWEIDEKRRFADFELDMLQEMGWKIKSSAWKVPPTTPAR